jgi:hypothetical protein
MPRNGRAGRHMEAAERVKGGAVASSQAARAHRLRKGHVGLPVSSVGRESRRKGCATNDGGGAKRAPPMALHDGGMKGVRNKTGCGGGRDAVGARNCSSTHRGWQIWRQKVGEEGWWWQWRWPAHSEQIVFCSLADQTENCLGSWVLEVGQKGGRR